MAFRCSVTATGASAGWRPLRKPRHVLRWRAAKARPARGNYIMIFVQCRGLKHRYPRYLHDTIGGVGLHYWVAPVRMICKPFTFEKPSLPPKPSTSIPTSIHRMDFGLCLPRSPSKSPKSKKQEKQPAAPAVTVVPHEEEASPAPSGRRMPVKVWQHNMRVSLIKARPSPIATLPWPCQRLGLPCSSSVCSVVAH